MKFYRFPRDEARRNAWAAAVKRKDWKPNDSSWICSEHFLGGEKSNNPFSPAYIPTVFEHKSGALKAADERKLTRFHKLVATKRKIAEAVERKKCEEKDIAARLTEDKVRMQVAEITGEILEEAIAEMQSVLAAEVLNECACEVEEADTQSEGDEVRGEPSVAMLPCEDEAEGAQELSVLRAEISCLLRQNAALNSKLTALEKKMISYDSLKDDDNKIRFYTGLPSIVILKGLFDFISPYVSNSSRTAMPMIDQFIMVLVRLRLNLEVQHLAHHYGIHSSNVSRAFRKWINVMYERFKPLIKWPEREELYKTMPMAFRKKFRKCVTIIDCFEVFMERPAALMARAQTWSNYKQHNTCKFLIGITPQGSISFVSKAWGGRVSDVHLTENCGILENLMNGDLILADRGFNIHEAAGLFCAEVKLPAFTKGKPQLSQCEVDTTRELARVRIHVERVIGLLKLKYRILKCTLPISLIMCNSGTDYSMIDKIVTVCSALCNCCESVVPFN